MRVRMLRRIGIVAAPVAFAWACRTEPGPPIVVEADTTAVVSGPARPVVVPGPTPAAPEVVVIEERVSAPAQEPVAEAVAAPGEASPAPADAPVPAPGPIVLPAGTRIALVLRTPLHSASTRVGDRFAARTALPVMVGGRTVLEPGALVEGKVAGVVSAGDSGEAGRIELDFRTLVLADGGVVPLEAEIASVAGREAEPARRPGVASVAGSAAGGAILGGAVGGTRGAVIGAVVGAVGATLVAGARDHEVVVPSETPLEITLTAPLELPAPQ